MDSFSAHGDHQLEVRHRLLVVRVSTFTNIEEQKRIFGLVSEYVRKFSQYGCALMLLIDGPFLMTPDAEAFTRQGHAGLVAQGMRAFAVVLSDFATQTITAAMLKRIHGDAPCPMKFFDSEAEALIWLEPFLEVALPQPAS